MKLLNVLTKEEVVDLEESFTIEKRQLLRNNEYYTMQHTFDELYNKSCKNYKFSNLMQYITSERNILLAYRNIKRIKVQLLLERINLIFHILRI